MKLFWLLAISLIFGVSIGAMAQETPSLTGRVVDAVTGEPLVGATAVLLDSRNNQKFGGMTNASGVFNLQNIASGDYKLRISYVSYLTTDKNISVRAEGRTDAGTIKVKAAEIKTGEVEITAKAPIAQQKEDTTEYNSSAFKTRPDATAEDLVKKVPGVQVEQDGTVKAHGEDVKRVLVDGKPFFGDDPTLALRNLPADVIDKVQVYDKMSDQAEFTGFDDGQSEKAMNIITKKDKRKGVFGNASAGGGTGSRYSANANVNIFNEGTKLSILGKSNNINEQNFSIQDIVGATGGSARGQGMPGGGGRAFGQGGGGGQRGGSGSQQGGRGPGGGGGFQGRNPSGFNPADFMVGTPNGITRTHAIGTNYTDTWGDHVSVTGSYFFNYSNNRNDASIDQQFFYPSEDNLSNTSYNEDTHTASDNYNHRFNMKLDYMIDSSNSLTFRPRISYQSNDKTENSLSQSYLNNNVQTSNSNRTTTSDLEGLNISGSLLYRHKFDTPGRTFSLNLSGDSKDKSGSSYLLSNNEYFEEPSVQTATRAEFINQYTTLPSSGYNLSLNGTYTEPIDSNNLVSLNYTASYQRNTANRTTFDFDSAVSAYDQLDVPLSSRFNNNYYTQGGGLGYRLRGSNFSLVAQANYQWSKLMNNQELPYTTSLDYTFNNILPSLMFNYKMSDKTNLRLFYRTNTNLPAVEQLQDVVDNTNPSKLSAGNPALKQEYSHMIVGRYSSLSEDRSNIMLGVLALNVKSNTIANAYTIAPKDTIIGNNTLPAGGQFIRPVNLDGYWSGRTFLTYGLPVGLIGSNLNFNVSGSYTHSPNLYNDIKSTSNIYNVSGQVVISSNISENLDFTLSGRAGWNKTNNSTSQVFNSQYNDYSASANLNWIIWNGIFVEANMQYNNFTNISPSSSVGFTLLNLGLGKKFFENRAEVKLYAFDVLNQNKSISTFLADNYIENDRNLTLGQYLMLKLTYNLR